MKCVKTIFEDNEKINEIEYINEDAYRELSILLINKTKNKHISVYNVINREGLHEIKGSMATGMNYRYNYHFTGYDVEGLPIL